MKPTSFAAHLDEVPSLQATLRDRRWLSVAWSDAVAKAIEETGLEDFPEFCPWPVEQALSPDFFPRK